MAQVESQKNSMGMPIRSQEWVKEIPAGVMAIVGHQILSTEKPVIKVNAIGGKAMFLDTGAGKGGKLSYYDIEIGGILNMGRPDIETWFGCS